MVIDTEHALAPFITIFKGGYQMSCVEWLNTETGMCRRFDPVELYHHRTLGDGPEPVAIIESYDEIRYFTDVPEELKPLLPEGLASHPRPGGFRPLT